MMPSMLRELAGGEGAILLAAGAVVAAVLMGLAWSLVRRILPSSKPREAEPGEAPAGGSFAHTLSASASDLPDGELCRVAGIPRNLLPLLRARPAQGTESTA
ncbi:MAG: hypothetical protein EA350_09375 [Gemmatimonadales bacterium]|nr:MAG: hypothetical protein EA350_09375 [Gemmatimonadales bacterium]